MAQERLGMRNHREVLRLKFELGWTDTEVSASVRRQSVVDELGRNRVGVHRRSLGADTLLRLMLGRQLTEEERVEFAGLVRFMRARRDLR